ncbi:MAG: porin [Candidatus Binataceae bacterium]
MKTRSERFSAAARYLVAVAAIATAAAVMLRPSTANAVEYLKVCTLYGAYFYYEPGTDICLDPAHNDTREQTPFGTWRWQAPASPFKYVQSPAAACQGGRLVKFGDITASGLYLDPHGRYVTTTHLPISTTPGQYIMSVILSGGFYTIDQTVSQLPACPASNRFVTDNTDASCTSGSAPAGGGSTQCEVTCVGGAWQCTGNGGGDLNNGNFCIFPHNSTWPYVTPTETPSPTATATASPTGVATPTETATPTASPTPEFFGFPLGCIDTTPLTSAPATIAFAPNSVYPPQYPYSPDPLSIVNYPDLAGANGYQWSVPDAADIQGTLSVWLCYNK